MRIAPIPGLRPSRDGSPAARQKERPRSPSTHPRLGSGRGKTGPKAPMYAGVHALVASPAIRSSFPQYFISVPSFGTFFQYLGVVRLTLV